MKTTTILMLLFSLVILILIIYVVYWVLDGYNKSPLGKLTQKEEDYVNIWLKKKGEYRNCLNNKDFIGATSIGRQLSFGEDRIQTDILSHSNNIL